MDSQDPKILFKTNSEFLLKKLIPNGYRQPVGPSDCALTIEDESITVFRLKSYDLQVVVDLNVLEQISRHWLVILGNTGRMPSLRIDLSIVPPSLRNSVCNIIRNCGHVRYYNLGDYSEDKYDLCSKSSPPKDVRVLMNQLEEPTEELQLINYLQMIYENKDSESIYLIPTHEVFDTAYRFFKFMKEWLASESMGRDDRKLFKRVEWSEQLASQVEGLQGVRKTVMKRHQMKWRGVRSPSRRIRGRPPETEESEPEAREVKPESKKRNPSQPAIPRNRDGKRRKGSVTLPLTEQLLSNGQGGFGDVESNMKVEEVAATVPPESCLDHGFIHVFKIRGDEEMEVPLKYFKLTRPGEKTVPMTFIRGPPRFILEIVQTMDWEANESGDDGNDEGISCNGIEVDQQPKPLDAGMLTYITRTGLYYRQPPTDNKEKRRWLRLGGRIFVRPDGEWYIVELISKGTQMLNGFKVECRLSSGDCQPDVREGHYELDLTMSPPEWTWRVKNFVGLRRYHRKNNSKKGNESCVIFDIDMDEDPESLSRFIAVDGYGHFAPVEKSKGTRRGVNGRIRSALKPYTLCMWNSRVRKLQDKPSWSIWEFVGGWYRPVFGRQFFDVANVSGSSTSQRFNEKSPESR